MAEASSNSHGNGSDDEANSNLLQEYAGTLKERCRRVYQWNQDMSNRVFNSYRQFLDLKGTLEDWNATILSPSSLVDQMWHQHILDTLHYEKYCQSVCGRMIHHDPDGGVDVAAREARLRTTHLTLKARFEGQVDEFVWDLPAPSSRDESSRRRQRSASASNNEERSPIRQRTAPDNAGEVSNDDENSEVTIHWAESDVQLKMPFQQDAMSMFYIYYHCASRRDADIDDLELYYQEDQTGQKTKILRSDKLDLRRLESGDRLVCAVGQAVSVRITSKDGRRTPLTFQLERSSTTSSLYKSYATKKRLDVRSIRLYHEGNIIKYVKTENVRRLDTPRLRQWHGSVKVECSVLQNHKPISIGLRDGTGQEIFLATAMTTKFQTMFEQYARMNGVEISTLRFMFNGKWIDPDDTPWMLEMEGRDVIAVLSSAITIRVRDQTGKEVSFIVKATTKLNKIFMTYAQRIGVQTSSLRFLIDGERLEPDETPEMYDMEDGDQMDVMLDQTGC
jgi:small ubiquitin-related modifier